MKKWIFILSLLIGQSALAKLPSDKVLRVGLPAFPPFAYSDSSGTLRGAVVEYIVRLEKMSGIPMEAVLLPYARMVQDLTDGDLDSAVIFHNANLADSVEFVAKVSEAKVMVLPRPGMHLTRYEHLLDLRSIAVIRNASFEARFDADLRLNKYPINDYRQGLQMLRLGRVDAIVGSLSGLEFSSHQQGAKLAFWGTPLPLENKSWWLHLSKASSHRHLATKLKLAVDSLYEPDLIYDLYRQDQDGIQDLLP